MVFSSQNDWRKIPIKSAHTAKKTQLIAQFSQRGVIGGLPRGGGIIQTGIAEMAKLMANPIEYMRDARRVVLCIKYLRDATHPVRFGPDSVTFRVS